MPWKETCVPDERLRFVVACIESEDSMAALCRRFGVSRRVGYKWLTRYKEAGPAGLGERSRAPHTSPNRADEEVERRILSMRADHPTWGPRKLLVAVGRRCERDGEEIDLPAASTVGQMLKRAGLVPLTTPAGARDVGAALGFADDGDRRRRRRGRSQRAVERRLQGVVPHGRRPPLPPADRDRRVQPLPAAVPEPAADRRPVGDPGVRGGVPRVRPAGGDPHGQRFPVRQHGPGRAEPVVGVVAAAGGGARADRPGQAAAERQPRADARDAQARDGQPAGTDDPRRAAAVRRVRARVQRRAAARGPAGHDDAGVAVRPVAVRVPGAVGGGGRVRRRLGAAARGRHRQVPLGRRQGVPQPRAGGPDGRAAGLRADAVADAVGAGRYFAVRFMTVELGVFDARRGRMLRPREAPAPGVPAVRFPAAAPRASPGESFRYAPGLAGGRNNRQGKKYFVFYIYWMTIIIFIKAV